MLSVVLIDGPAPLQHALRLLLSTVAGVDVHAAANGLSDALGLIAELRPDVIILGTDPRRGGVALELLERLPETGCTPRIAVVAGSPPDDGIATRAGTGALACFDPASDGSALTRWMQAQVAESGVLASLHD